MLINWDNIASENITLSVETEFYHILDEIQEEYRDWFKRKNLILHNLYEVTVHYPHLFTWEPKLFENELTEEIRKKVNNKLKSFQGFIFIRFKQ